MQRAQINNNGNAIKFLKARAVGTSAWWQGDNGGINNEMLSMNNTNNASCICCNLLHSQLDKMWMACAVRSFVPRLRWPNTRPFSLLVSCSVQCASLEFTHICHAFNLRRFCIHLWEEWPFWRSYSQVAIRCFWFPRRRNTRACNIPTHVLLRNSCFSHLCVEPTF